MRAGDVVLIDLPRITGPSKLRPALTLAELPGPFQNVLICGISTRFQELDPEWDEIVHHTDEDYPTSGLRRESAIRLSYLYAADRGEMVGVIGRVHEDRLRRLAKRLADRLLAS